MIHFSYTGKYTTETYCKSDITIYLFKDLFYVQDMNVSVVNSKILVITSRLSLSISYLELPRRVP